MCRGGTEQCAAAPGNLQYLGWLTSRPAAAALDAATAAAACRRSEATASELPAGPSLARLPPPPRKANASQLLPAATGPPSRRRRTQMLKPLGWPRRPAPPRAPPQRPDPSLTDPESSEARALRGHPTDSDSDPRAYAARHE